LKRHIENELAERVRLAEALCSNAALIFAIGDIIKACVEALKAGKKILFAGNGGSAADAQHLAGELVGRFLYDRPSLPAIALTTDASVLTAIGNDYGFEHLFVRQIEALGHRGDVLLAFSTSGLSPNVLAGLGTARKLGLVTVGFSGETGGKMNELCDLMLRAPSASTAHIQEIHMSVGHIICGLIEAMMFPA
jgi:D-sedoheptulose 7-phosphate isomerase